MLEQNQIGQNPRPNRRMSTPVMTPVATPATTPAAAPAIAAPAAARPVAGTPGWAFASADDYDATGILAGVDLSASLYWWMPELYTSQLTSPAEAQGPPPVPVATAAHPPASTAGEPAERGPRAGQAARRSGSRSPAAA